MAIFSQYFSLNKVQAELDFIDIDSEKDLPLFIDPYALSIRNDDWSQKCNQYIVSFFQTAIDYIRAGKEREAKKLLDNLSEPNETCLGVSRKIPKGRGVSGKQALDLYQALAQSQAAKKGLLSELADCDLFVEGIGYDKISDITTNIIRELLIEYTQKQCGLYNIPLIGNVASGKFWNPQENKWAQSYAQLPIINDKKILLVPKSIVRFKLGIDGQSYYNNFVLNFLQQENLNANTSLVQVLKNGERKVFKKDLKEIYPYKKDWLAEFTSKNPSVLIKCKKFVKEQEMRGILDKHILSKDFNERAFAKSLTECLGKISIGSRAASQYHSFIIGALELIFWPSLIYPKKEHEIHDGRKRIDISYTNNALYGFFHRIHTAHDISSNLIMVECKNYNADVSNPELDQLSGRFSPNRGKFGFLLYRKTDNYEQLLKRCKDTAGDLRGVIIPLGDEQLTNLLQLIANGERMKIDEYLNSLFVKVIS